MWVLSCERRYLSKFMFTSRVHRTGELRKHEDLMSTTSLELQFGEMLPKACRLIVRDLHEPSHLLRQADAIDDYDVPSYNT